MRAHLLRWLTCGIALFFAPGLLPAAGPDESELAGDRASHPAAGISPQGAVALAVNDLVVTDDGYRLRHPRHTATFTAEGVTFEPRRGGWSTPSGNNRSSISTRARAALRR